MIGITLSEKQCKLAKKVKLVKIYGKSNFVYMLTKRGTKLILQVDFVKHRKALQVML